MGDGAKLAAPERRGGGGGRRGGGRGGGRRGEGRCVTGRRGISWMRIPFGRHDSKCLIETLKINKSALLYMQPSNYQCNYVYIPLCVYNN